MGEDAGGGEAQAVGALGVGGQRASKSQTSRVDRCQSRPTSATSRTAASL